MAAAAIIAFPDPANEELASGWELVDLRHIIRLERFGRKRVCRVDRPVYRILRNGSK